MKKYFLKRHLKIILYSIPLISIIPQCYASPDIYIFLGRGPASGYKKFLQDAHIKGAQIIYTWRSLEPEKNIYNFQAIKRDLKTLNEEHKKLFIQIQDRSFSPNNIPVPSYLLTNEYEGGIAQQGDHPGEEKPATTGWVAKQWVPAVQKRFQKLLRKLGDRFDGEIQGINLAETAIDLNERKLPATLTCHRYFHSIIENMGVMRASFHKSSVVQYVNFFPCEWNNDHHYMSGLFAYAHRHHIGLGGPDDIPYQRGQMKNSYPFFHRYIFQLPLVAIAVQEPDYTYTNSKNGKPFTVKELYDFASQYLGANIIFWNIQEPQFSQQLLPWLDQGYVSHAEVELLTLPTKSA